MNILAFFVFLLPSLTLAAAGVGPIDPGPGPVMSPAFVVKGTSANADVLESSLLRHGIPVVRERDDGVPARIVDPTTRWECIPPLTAYEEKPRLFLHCAAWVQALEGRSIFSFLSNPLETIVPRWIQPGEVFAVATRDNQGWWLGYVAIAGRQSDTGKRTIQIVFLHRGRDALPLARITDSMPVVNNWSIKQTGDMILATGKMVGIPWATWAK